MKKIEVYESFDNQLFKSKDDCGKHESKKIAFDEIVSTIEPYLNDPYTITGLKHSLWSVIENLLKHNKTIKIVNVNENRQIWI